MRVISSFQWAGFGYDFGLLDDDALRLAAVPCEAPSSKGIACPVCGKNISRKDNLKAHLRLHTGERPYPCPHCPYRSNEPGNLRKHVHAHHLDLLQAKDQGAGQAGQAAEAGMIAESTTASGASAGAAVGTSQSSPQPGRQFGALAGTSMMHPNHMI